MTAKPNTASLNTAGPNTSGPIPVLFVEDDASLLEATTQALSLEGFAVSPHSSAASALRAIDAEFAGVVVSDVRLPGMDGIEFFARLHTIDDELPVIFTTGHGDVAMAVEAMKNGAADFYAKPYALDDLVRSIRRAAGRRALVMENRKLREALRSRGAERFFGSSRIAEQLRRMITEIARADVDLLVTGETGTGKNFVARMIHDLSPRETRPFVTVDAGILNHADAELLLFGRDPVAGLSRSGLIERANGGTLVLDELDAIPRAMRARILSVLENRSFLSLGADRARPVNIRVIATMRDISAFKQSPASDDQALLHRLGGITIALPPLASRREDIPEIFRQFVDQCATSLDTAAPNIAEREWSHLINHDWPGNLRELHDFARNFVLGLSRLMEPVDQPDEQTSLAEMVASFERAVLEDALRAADGRVVDLPHKLQLPRKTLYDKLARHGLKPKDFRA